MIIRSFLKLLAELHYAFLQFFKGQMNILHIYNLILMLNLNCSNKQQIKIHFNPLKVTSRIKCLLKEHQQVDYLFSYF